MKVMSKCISMVTQLWDRRRIHTAIRFCLQIVLSKGRGGHPLLDRPQACASSRKQACRIKVGQLPLLVLWFRENEEGMDILGAVHETLTVEPEGGEAKLYRAVGHSPFQKRFMLQLIL